MSELNTDTGPEATASASASSDTIFQVKITKGGKNAFLTVDVSELPDDAYRAVITAGLEAYANSRMSKVPGPKAVEEKPSIANDRTEADGSVIEGAYSMAMRIAAENIAALKTGKTKAKKSGEKSELPREINTEAMRIARNMVKDAIREAKGYPSTYPASEITAMAKVFISRKPEIVAQAKENIAKRKALESSTALEINVLDLGKPDPVKLAEREAKAEAAAKKRADKPLSAKQAGKTKASGTVPPARKSRGDVPASQIAH